MTTSPSAEPTRTSTAPLWIALAAILHLALAWPGAADRGVIAEEVQPYLRHYPRVLADPATFLPPNDDPRVRDAVLHGEPTEPRWVGTRQWPEIGYLGRDRVWPVFVRGHQSALGTYWGIATQRWLGGGIAGVRRSSVLLGLVLVLLTFALGRRLGLSDGWAGAATLGCVLSTGLWFFCRTGYGFELASRTLMMAALTLAAPRERLSARRASAVGVAVACAILSRATIAVTLVPPLALLLAHPARWAGWRRAALPLVIGGGVPVALVAVALVALPFGAGNTPGSNLPIGHLAARTLTAPATAWFQLGWLVDARVVLDPLVSGATAAHAGVIRPILGLAVVGTALARWWWARAREPERLLCAGLLGNVLFGAWLYGDPIKFQLGMALEPLFALAVAAQLAEFGRALLGSAIATALLAARAAGLAALASAERTTDNPMLSGRAQRELIRVLAEERIASDALVTTTYDHVGVIEIASGETIWPTHAWPVLTRFGGEEHLVEVWVEILDRHPVCWVLLTRAPSLVAGSFSDNDAVARALDRALAARRRGIEERRTIAGDGDSTVFELVRLSGCGESGASP